MEGGGAGGISHLDTAKCSRRAALARAWRTDALLGAGAALAVLATLVPAVEGAAPLPSPPCNGGCPRAYGFGGGA